MSNLFIIKHKVFEPNNPFVKFKPATAKTLIGAKTKAQALIRAEEEITKMVKAKFPKAEIKFLGCEQIRFDFFFQ